MDGRRRTSSRPKQPGFIAREVTFLKTLTGTQIKATLPSPALLGERMWDPEKSAPGLPEARGLRPRLRADPARARLELLCARASTSCRSTTRTCACSSIPRCARSYDDPDRAADFAVDMTNQVVDGHRRREARRPPLPPRRRAGPRREHHAGGYDPILPHLNRLKVHHLTMEFTAPGAGDMSVFRELREDFEIGLGCVDTEPGGIDTAAEIAAAWRRR